MRKGLGLRGESNSLSGLLKRGVFSMGAEQRQIWRGWSAAEHIAEMTQFDSRVAKERAELETASARKHAPARVVPVEQIRIALGRAYHADEVLALVGQVRKCAAALRHTSSPQLSSALVNAAIRVRQPTLLLSVLNDPARFRVFPTPSQWQRLISSFSKIPASAEDTRSVQGVLDVLKAAKTHGQTMAPLQDAAAVALASWDEPEAALTLLKKDRPDGDLWPASVAAALSAAFRRKGDLEAAKAALARSADSDAEFLAEVTVQDAQEGAVDAAVERIQAAHMDRDTLRAVLGKAYATAGPAIVEPVRLALKEVNPEVPSRASVRRYAFSSSRRSIRSNLDHEKLCASHVVSNTLE